MGGHSMWRKVAKKDRRKRLRQKIAIKRLEDEEKEKKERESSPSYIKSITEQKALEIFQAQEEERLAKERELQWLKTEEEAQKQWRELQIKLEKLREERAKEEERILQEWKREQTKIHQEKERRKRLQEENEMKLQLVKNKIEEFISNGGSLPEELNVSMETNPNKPICPFFHKTGACRFKDVCSRNHIRPGVSKILLIPSFYSHFSLQHSKESEYGSDFTLEYDDSETYNDFKEFFFDVLPEFEKFGEVKQFKVCRNREPHLRGNVYVEYLRTRDALRAFKVFHCRWYGGKQLNVEFCNISSWKSAICGLSYNRKCPKGSSCNFLHVFINPNKMFHNADKDLHRNSFEEDNDYTYQSRNWRWSESPERNIDNKENYKRKLNHRKSKYDDRSRRDKKRKARSRSRSKSPTNQKRKRRKRSR